MSGRPITAKGKLEILLPLSLSLLLRDLPLRSPSLFLAPSPMSRPPFVAFLASVDDSSIDNIPALTTKLPSFSYLSSPSLSLPSSSPAIIALPCVTDSASPSLPTPNVDVSSPPSPFVPSLPLPLSSLLLPTTIALPCIADNVSLSPCPTHNAEVSSPPFPVLPSLPLPLSSLLFTTTIVLFYVDDSIPPPLVAADIPCPPSLALMSPALRFQHQRLQASNDSCCITRLFGN